MIIELLAVATLVAMSVGGKKAQESEESNEKVIDWDKEFDEGMGLIDLGDD